MFPRTVQVLIIVLGGALLGGCTGTSMSVNPDPASINVVVAKKCGAIGVKEVAADHVYSPAGSLVPGFAAALEKAGISDSVYYPSRPDDKVSMTLASKFDVEFDPNNGGNLTKSFFTGLSLFVLEPVFWFNYDYTLKGTVDIMVGKDKVKTLTAASSGEMSMKFLSLSEVQGLEGSTLAQAKESLYRQLMVELSGYCSR